MAQDEKTAKATLVQKKYTEMLLKIPHVMGVAVGLMKKDGAYTLLNVFWIGVGVVGMIRAAGFAHS